MSELGRKLRSNSVSVYAKTIFLTIAAPTSALAAIDWSTVSIWTTRSTRGILLSILLCLISGIPIIILFSRAIIIITGTSAILLLIIVVIVIIISVRILHSIVICILSDWRALNDGGLVVVLVPLNMSGVNVWLTTWVYINISLSASVLELLHMWGIGAWLVRLLIRLLGLVHDAKLFWR